MVGQDLTKPAGTPTLKRNQQDAAKAVGVSTCLSKGRAEFPCDSQES